MSWQACVTGNGSFVECAAGGGVKYDSAPLNGLIAVMYEDGDAIFGSTASSTSNLIGAGMESPAAGWDDEIKVRFTEGRVVGGSRGFGQALFCACSWIGMIEKGTPPLRMRVGDHLHFASNAAFGYGFWGFSEVFTTFMVDQMSHDIATACGIYFECIDGVRRAYALVTDGLGVVLTRQEIDLNLDEVHFFEVEVRSTDRTVEWYVDGALVYSWTAPPDVQIPRMPTASSTSVQPCLNYVVRNVDSSDGVSTMLRMSPFASFVVIE